MTGILKRVLVVGAMAAAFAAPSLAAASTGYGLFASEERKSYNVRVFTKWNSAVQRYYRTLSRTRNLPQMRRWRAFIRQTRRLPRHAQLRAVQRFVNAVAYRSDAENYGRDDYWAIPSQFFARGGDCEDFAIVKYLSLKALGWNQRQLRLVVLMDHRLRQRHAVLAVFYNGRRYILDNQFRGVVRDTQIRHYSPIYSISERSWWRHL